MNEKELIKGNASSIKNMPIIIMIIGAIIVAVPFVMVQIIHEGSSVPVVIGAITILVGLILWLYISRCSIVVTDKRVYGTAAFGTRVDLPLDSISAVGTSALNGISVASASGSVKFLGFANNTEVHKVISDLLINRQNTSNKEIHTTIKQEMPQSSADELKKFKELLDSGIITQEEFDAKKKQLLGL
ncbi:MAG: SHOCT domain-containing protein [Oscillospiraceae bacterium]|nr:SHOCT domain-containing protein [Oscillospiraceae bacterium]